MQNELIVSPETKVSIEMVLYFHKYQYIAIDNRFQWPVHTKKKNNICLLNKNSILFFKCCFKIYDTFSPN